MDRVCQFLDRVQGPHANDVEFQEAMWAFFQNCWHLKDWVDHDPLASDAQKKAVLNKAHDSPLLKMCHDLCNGTKHLGLNAELSPGAGAAHDHVNIMTLPGGSIMIDCIVQVGYGNARLRGRMGTHSAIRASQYQAAEPRRQLPAIG
jgi:hypothetical protein